MRSLPSRAALVTSVTGVVLLSLAGPAGAHVEATVGPGAQAGGGPVTVAFSAEAESPTAGVAGITTQLPEGVLPEWVTLESGPPGWTLGTTADGYTVTGPALPQGADADYTIRIGQLPADATEYVFKTLVDYSDGSEDAWIEVPAPGGPEPDSPAPVITVAAAPAPTSSAAPSTSSSAAATTTPAAPSPAAATTADGGSSTGTVLGVVGVVALALVALAVAVRMRSRRSTGS